MERPLILCAAMALMLATACTTNDVTDAAGYVQQEQAAGSTYHGTWDDGHEPVSIALRQDSLFIAPAPLAQLVRLAGYESFTSADDAGALRFAYTAVGSNQQSWLCALAPASYEFHFSAQQQAHHLRVDFGHYSQTLLNLYSHMFSLSLHVAALWLDGRQLTPEELLEGRDRQAIVTITATAQ